MFVDSNFAYYLGPKSWIGTRVELPEMGRFVIGYVNPSKHLTVTARVGNLT